VVVLVSACSFLHKISYINTAQWEGLCVLALSIIVHLEVNDIPYRRHTTSWPVHTAQWPWKFFLSW